MPELVADRDGEIEEDADALAVTSPDIDRTLDLDGDPDVVSDADFSAVVEGLPEDEGEIDTEPDTEKVV